MIYHQQKNSLLKNNVWLKIARIIFQIIVGNFQSIPWLQNSFLFCFSLFKTSPISPDIGWNKYFHSLPRPRVSRFSGRLLKLRISVNPLGLRTHSWILVANWTSGPLAHPAKHSLVSRLPSLQLTWKQQSGHQNEALAFDEVPRKPHYDWDV